MATDGDYFYYYDQYYYDYNGLPVSSEREEEVALKDINAETNLEEIAAY